MSNISETADRAADYLEQNGHTKGCYVDNNGSVCLVGALGLGNQELIDSMYGDNAHVRNAVSEFLGIKSPNSVGQWNDEPERKPEEVIQVLRDVATKHRSDAMTVEAEK